MDFDDEIVDEARLVANSQLLEKQRSIAEMILARNDEAILEAFEKRCRDVNSGQAVLDFTRALFHFLLPLAEKDEFSRPAKLLVLVVVHVIELVNSKKLSVEKKVLDCFSFFAQEISALPRRLLPSVVEAVVSNLEINGTNDEGRSLELLPNCLTMIMSSVESVLVSGEQGDNLQISGREYRDHIVSRLVVIPWSKLLLSRMACMLRELVLEPGQIEEFVKKIFTHMKEVEVQDLPSLVYQLLLLASQGHKRAIISGITSFFSKLQASESQRIGQNGSKNGVEVFRQVEGTVVLHINFAVKQDPALGVEWLALARTGSGPVTPFTVSVLLSLARIQRFEQACFDILKASAVKPYQDCERCRESLWASSVLGAMCLRTAKDMELSFMRTVESSAFGWDHIIPSVVQMGFIFIESGPSGRFLSSVDAGRTEHASDTQELGLKMLITAFKVHEMARDEIIEQSKCRIIGLKSQQSAMIIRMLAQLVHKYPKLMLHHGSRLKECLDYFTFLPNAPASSIIQALCPLFQLSRDLQDHTILVLRKSMFSREASTRMIAVQGLLDLVIADKQARVMNNSSESESWLRMSMSEASSSQSFSQWEPRRGAIGRNKNLLQELLGLLRRCLSQQVCVKEALYKRLPSLLLVDPASAEDIFDLVWPHFCHFYEERQDGAANLKLDDCVAIRNMNVNVEEPFDHLLACVHQLLTLQPQGVSGEDSLSVGDGFGFAFSEDQDTRQLSSGESLAAAFLKIRKSVQSSSLGDFKLDKTENFSLDTVEGERKMEQGRIFLGVLEVLIDAAVAELTSTDKESRKEEIKLELKNCLLLFDSLHQTVNLKQHVKGPAKHLFKAGPTGRPLNSRSRRSVDSGGQNGNLGQGKQVKFAIPRAVLEKRVPFLSSPCIAYLLHESTEKDDSILLAFALSSCLRHLKGISSQPVEGNEMRTPFTGLHGNSWKTIANPLFRVILSNKADVSRPQSPSLHAQEKPKKSKKASEATGEGPMLIAVRSFDVLCKTASDKQCLPELLLDITSDFESNGDGDAPNDTHNQTIGIMQGCDAKLLHHWLSKQVRPLVEELLARSQLRELEVVAKCILLLGRRLPPPMMKEHAMWATNLCKEHSIPNTGASSALAALALSLNTPPEDLTLARGLSSELLKVMGFEETEPQESSLNFPIIDSTTRNTIAGFLLQIGEKALKDMEWLITKIKTLKPLRRTETRNTIAGFLATPRRPQLEEMLFIRLEAVVLVLSDFSTMTLAGVVAEQFLKIATHLYKCLAASTKSCIATKGFIQSIPSIHFQKLAEVTCKKLTAPLYLFMAVMQRDQQENQTDKGSLSKIKREGRTIPNLIYHIEDYERYLIQLSRITKVNLMRHAKRSTARDFKIVTTGKKNRTVARRSTDSRQGRPEEEEAEAEEEGEEAGGVEEEEAEAEGEGDEAGENEEEELLVDEDPVNEEAIDGEDTAEVLEGDHEVKEVAAPDEVEEDNPAVIMGSDEENGERLSRPVSGSRAVGGSAHKRRGPVIVDSDDESDGEQAASYHVSGKRTRSA